LRKGWNHFYYLKKFKAFHWAGFHPEILESSQVPEYDGACGGMSATMYPSRRDKLQKREQETSSKVLPTDDELKMSGEKSRSYRRSIFIISIMETSLEQRRRDIRQALFQGTHLNCAFAFLNIFNALAFMCHLFVYSIAPCRSISSTGNTKNSRKLLQELARVDNYFLSSRG
jgi:hypothetical protein